MGIHTTIDEGSHPSCLTLTHACLARNLSAPGLPDARQICTTACALVHPYFTPCLPAHAILFPQGSLVRAIRRLEELLRQLAAALRSVSLLRRAVLYCAALCRLLL